MKDSQSKSALEVLQKPAKVLAILDKEQALKNVEQKELPKSFDSALAEELLVAIAEGTAKEDVHFAHIYESVQKKNEIPHRDIPTAIDLAGKAYELVSNHWGEIHFILIYLNKKGYFDKIKDKSKFKTFFAALFDEKVEKQDSEKGDEGG